MTALMGVFGIGVGVLLVGAAPADAIWLAFAGMALSGAMMAFANGPLLAIVQSAVRPEMQGRVMSLMGSVSTAVSPLGLLIAGPFSDWAGVRAWYLLSGGVTLLTAVVAYFVPVVMNVEDNRR
jgi:DHA3 family macrolide efflux protein-like MFS transporter